MLRALILVLWLAAAGWSAPPRLRATLARNGEILVRGTVDPAPVLSVRPEVRVGSGAPQRAAPGDDAGKARFHVGSPPVRVDLDIAATVEAGADSRILRLRCAFVPEKDLPGGAPSITFSIPAREWTKARMSRGEDEAFVSAEGDRKPLLALGAGDLLVTRQGTQLRVEPGAQPLRVDDRRPDGDEIDIRVGPADAPEGIWAAGKRETFELVVALPGPVRLFREEPLVLAAGDDWIPLDPPANMLAGSALDLSAVLKEPPAGSTGRVVVRSDGHLGTEKGTKPLRLWGVNLSGAALAPEALAAELLAERLARMGYNAVRFQGHDGSLFEGDALARLDQFAFELKKRGIWLTTDLWFARPVAGYDPETFKAAVLLRDFAFETWKEQARKFLLHVNPHTGVAWKDEPALAYVGVIDNPNLPEILPRITGPLRGELEAAWNAWRKDRSLPVRPLPREVGEDVAGREFSAFAATLHAKAFARMETFLRKEIGTNLLLTDLNGPVHRGAYTSARMPLDLVDAQFGWDPPVFLDQPGGLPSSGRDNGDGTLAPPRGGPHAVAMRRIYGKPFVVSAHRYFAPNPSRFEGPLATAAMASLQDWDGLFAQRWSTATINPAAPAILDFDNVAGDPAVLAAERLAALLYRRRDARPGVQGLTDLVSRETVLERFDTAPGPGFPELAYVLRVGSRIVDKNRPLPEARPTEVRLSGADAAAGIDKLLQEGRLNEGNKTSLDADLRHSETNEIFVEGTIGSLRVITPLTIGGVGPESETLKFGRMVAQIEDADAAVWATSLDGKPVPESNRLLVSHITDVQNTDTRFLSSERKVLERWGGAPQLARRGKATVLLVRTAPARDAELWRLDAAGRRLTTVPVEREGNNLAFVLETKGPDGKATLCYELVVKPPVAASPSARKPAARPAPRRR
ncbi:MAG: hypothetical protein ACKO5K_16925 [Armatimonadota bacterium]